MLVNISPTIIEILIFNN